MADRETERPPTRTPRGGGWGGEQKAENAWGARGPGFQTVRVEVQHPGYVVIGYIRVLSSSCSKRPLIISRVAPRHSTAQLAAALCSNLHRRAQPWRAAHRESSCSPSCGASERRSSAAKLAAAPPSGDRQRMAMSMSTDGHTSTSASATPAKLAAIWTDGRFRRRALDGSTLRAADGERVRLSRIRARQYTRLGETQPRRSAATDEAEVGL